MLRQQVGGEGFLKDWRIQNGVAIENKCLAASLEPNGLGGPAAQIHRNDLLAFLLAALKKWQSHNNSLTVLAESAKTLQAASRPFASLLPALFLFPWAV